MIRRPFPVWPRGAGRRGKNLRAAPVIVAVPRDCPMWQIQAMRALFKPQLKAAILHRRETVQRWSNLDRVALERALCDLSAKLGAIPEFHFPDAGEYRMIATCPREQLDLARALAIVLSRHLPKRWIVVGKLMVRDERFYRRGGRFNLALKSARDVHLPRALRAIIGNRSRHEEPPHSS